MSTFVYIPKGFTLVREHQTPKQDHKPQFSPEQLKEIGDLGLGRILLNFVGYTEITPDQLQRMTLQELTKAVGDAFYESEKDSFHASCYMNPKERIKDSTERDPTNVSTLALVRYHRDIVCKVFKKYLPELFLWITPRKDKKTGKNITGLRNTSNPKLQSDRQVKKTFIR